MTGISGKVKNIGKKAASVVQAEAEKRAARNAPRSESSELGYVLILTYGRTGSTVLQGALNTVPGVSIRGENYGVCNHMEKVYAAAARAGKEQSGGVTTGTTSPWYGAHMIDTNGLAASLRDSLVNDVLKPPAGSTITGFKEIRHTSEYFESFEDLLEYTVFLDSLLPGVRFVVNSRDVEETIQSGWWKDKADAKQVLERTREWMLRLPAAIEERLGKGRVVTMAYEQWNKNPAELARMLTELGLPVDMDLLVKVSTEDLQHMGPK